MCWAVYDPRVAIELTDELIDLQRAALAAQAEALASPYTAESWAPWREAAAQVQQAITDHAAATQQSRVDVEMAVKKAARAPEPDSE